MANEPGQGDSPPKRQPHPLDTAVSREPLDTITKRDIYSGQDDDSLHQHYKDSDAYARQLKYERDVEDREERIEYETERLYQLLEQEGFIKEDPEALRYQDVGSYVVNGIIPQDEEFAAGLANVLVRDSQGEWEENVTLGEPIPKKNKQEIAP